MASDCSGLPVNVTKHGLKLFGSISDALVRGNYYCEGT